MTSAVRDRASSASTGSSRCVISRVAAAACSPNIARERPSARIIAVSPDEATARRLALVWGVEPTVRDPVSTFDEAIVQARALMAELEGVEHGVLIGGLPFGSEGRTNVLHIIDS